MLKSTMNRRLMSTALIGSLTLAPLAGCSNLPGNSKEQGAVIGGAGGALAGAAISKNNRLLGALIGGALGAGGGYLIGAQKDKIDNKKKDDAVKASRDAERNPARASDVEKSRTADLNDDGFVTLDEVVAMQDAHLSNREMIDRLERTQQVFELTDQQETFLRDRGVSKEVVTAMRDMNHNSARQASDRVSPDVRSSDRISSDPVGSDRGSSSDRGTNSGDRSSGRDSGDYGNPARN